MLGGRCAGSVAGLLWVGLWAFLPTCHTHAGSDGTAQAGGAPGNAADAPLVVQVEELDAT